jgi:xanthine dehydrogenase accessory factor
VTPRLDALARTLDELGEPYVRATVVWVRPPSSGSVGDQAIVRSDGTLHGWIGGACTEPVVRAEARDVLAEGAPRLISLSPDPDGPSRPGVRAVAMSCASEGALEIFMEPVVPRPHVVIVGRSPAVGKLARLLDVMEWRVTVVDDEGKGGDLPGGLSVVGGFEAVGPVTGAIVVATQGHYDEDSLRWAVSTEAAHIGLVASRRRAETLIDHLRAVGVGDEDVARVRAPAGLDLGHVDHDEIAVAILAELVSLRASGLLGPGSAETAPAPQTAIDPVCGMTVEVAGARYTHEHAGEAYSFCCPGCRKSFADDPGMFLG